MRIAFGTHPYGYQKRMYLTDLRSLYELPGPWVSVYLDASRASERGAEEVGLRWRAAREALIEAGAEPAVIPSIEQVLSADDTGGGPHGLAVFASHDPAGDGVAVAHVETLPQPPSTISAELAPLPHVTPMLIQRGEQVSWLRVVVDRTGADIEQAVAGRVHRVETVEGSQSYPMTKTKPSGWSTRRYQAGVEVTWERNAADVAATATAMAEEADAEVLIVAGDVRARQLVVDHLPKLWRERTVQSESGSRAPGADPEPLDEATHSAVSQIAAARVEDALDRYRLQSAHDAADAGLSAAVDALQRGLAEAIILNPSTLDDASLWIGPEPVYLATTDKELRRLGVATPQRVRADDCLVRAAASTGAELFIVDSKPPELQEGVAVLLRNHPREAA